jgi:hypothetical protein
MGPFLPGSDAFLFTNNFPLTVSQAAQLIEIIPGVVSDLVLSICLRELNAALGSISIDLNPLPFGPAVTVSLPDVIIGQVLDNLVAAFAGSLIDLALDPKDTNYGRCGGMVFGGYDFYLLGWPVDGFGNQPPATGELGDYIFGRLLESLRLNGDIFVAWWTKVHVLPNVSRIATAALLGAATAFAGPIGIAIGVLIGNQIDFFNLGGPKSVLGSTKEEWLIIKSKLDAEAACPVGLIFGDKGNLFDQHQVLAVGYTDNGGGTATLTIWDNKDGNSSQTLRLDFRGNELKVSGTNITDDNKQIKGLFHEKYSPHQPPLSLRLP